MHNTKAQIGEQIMNLSLILQLVVLALGIVIGVWIFFYNSDYDFRGVDANILNTKIKQCLLDQQLDFALPQDQFEQELYQKCQLDSKVLQENWVIGIYLDGNQVYKKGDIVSCQLQDKNEDFPRCAESTFTKKIEDKQVTVSLTTGTNQQELIKKTA
jgi:hypothetical protein